MEGNLRSAHEVCVDLGIEIIPTTIRRRTDGAPQTTSIATIEKMLRKYGEGHTIFVLRTIAETEGNADELVSYTIEAVSRLVRDHPLWTDRGLDWFEAFDRIDLPAIRAQCRELVEVVPMADGICTLVFCRLFDLLGDPTPRKERKAARGLRGRHQIRLAPEPASDTSRGPQRDQ